MKHLCITFLEFFQENGSIHKNVDTKMLHFHPDHQKIFGLRFHLNVFIRPRRVSDFCECVVSVFSFMNLEYFFKTKAFFYHKIRLAQHYLTTNSYEFVT